MKRAEVTYGQLDKVLRSLGFSCHPTKHDPPGCIYEHKETGAVVMLPAFAESDRVFEYHLVAADRVGQLRPRRSLRVCRQTPESRVTVSSFPTPLSEPPGRENRQMAGSGAPANPRSAGRATWWPTRRSWLMRLALALLSSR